MPFPNFSDAILSQTSRLNALWGSTSNTPQFLGMGRSQGAHTPKNLLKFPPPDCRAWFSAGLTFAATALAMQARVNLGLFTYLFLGTSIPALL